MWSQRRGSKYGAKKTVYGGLKYDSKKEAGYAQELELRRKAGEIKEITSMPERDRSVTWVLDSQGITPNHRPEVRDEDDTKSLTLEELYTFLPDGRAVPREQMEPVQEALV